MSILENIAEIRKDANRHSQDFFIHFFKKFPQQQNRFSEYRGKHSDSLKSLAKFGKHPPKVLNAVLNLIERSGDQGALRGDAKKVAQMSQHSGMGMQDYTDLFSALISYLGETLGGSCDRHGWQAAVNSVTKALSEEV